MKRVRTSVHQRAEIRLQRILGGLIAGLRDKRLGIANVTEVELSRDYAHARVFVSFLSPRADGEAELEVLRSAAGHLRSRLAASGLRKAPHLRFFRDTLPERGRHMEELLKNLVLENEAEEKGD